MSGSLLMLLCMLSIGGCGISASAMSGMKPEGSCAIGSVIPGKRRCFHVEHVSLLKARPVGRLALARLAASLRDVTPL